MSSVPAHNPGSTAQTPASPTRPWVGFVAVLAPVVATAALIGLLVVLANLTMVCRPSTARVALARVEMRAIASALDAYGQDNGTFPTTHQGLAALVRRPMDPPVVPHWRGYLREKPQDPWHNPYRYTWQEYTSLYEHRSFGTDGRPGGEGEAADVVFR